MNHPIEHFFHFTSPASETEAGLVLSGEHAVLGIPEVHSFKALIQVYAEHLGQEGYFGNSLDSFQDCLNDPKNFWSVQPSSLDVQHLHFPDLPQEDLEPYTVVLIETVIHYHTHKQYNQQLDPVHIRRELQLHFPSMSEAQMEAYISPIPTTTLRVFFPAESKTVLQEVLDIHSGTISDELDRWAARGFTLPERFTL
ncbi:barstar family protein [Deinococcus roseus]|uniref:Barstar (barnase inhibitor) domain-containing protein n=1 Tax=Deinococcus roseus TaxID=392414 RepID=A0ABQ2CU60_9DEIO|nr:barstar family protein [Deinococcus roseus]GGJ21227.1 hypothetical protein GCM10008938_04290 [Deinococcus roseus]